MVRGVKPIGWLWLYAPIYAIHLFDERFYGEGTARWATRHVAIYSSEVHFTNSAWLAVNVPSFLLLTAAAVLVARERWPAWVAVSLASHFFLHGFVRLLGTIWFVSLSPGVFTGMLLCVPLAVGTWTTMRKIIPRGELGKGVLIGVLSFQPVWHGLLLPFF